MDYDTTMLPVLTAQAGTARCTLASHSAELFSLTPGWDGDTLPFWFGSLGQVHAFLDFLPDDVSTRNPTDDELDIAWHYASK